MKILIAGAGAIGSLFGGLLSKDNEVTLWGREKHIRAVRQNGLHISGTTELTAHPSTISAPSGSYELVIVTVKCYQTRSIAEELSGHIDAEHVLSLQNGIGNTEIIQSIMGAPVITGVTTHGAEYLGPGMVRHTGQGRTFIGTLDMTQDLSSFLEEISDTFASSSINTVIAENMDKVIWMKSIVNTCINVLSTIDGVRNGELAEDSRISPLCKESVEIAKAMEVNITLEESIQEVESVINETSNNRSSMLQDINAGKKTEIDCITGVLLQHAIQKGIDAKMMKEVYKKVKSLEK